MIFRSGGQTVQLRTADPAGALLAAEISFERTSGLWTTSGQTVNPDVVAGLPAVSRCLAMLSNDLAKQPLRVVDILDTDDGVADTTWQWTLLHDRPNDSISPYEFWRNACVSLAGYGNVFIEKMMGTGRFRGQVVELHVLDPSRVSIRRNADGSIQYRYNNGPWFASTQLVHIRNMSPNPADIIAPSPIQIFRDTFGHYLAANTYMSSFYKNNATPAGVIEFPEGMNESQTREFMELYNAQHQGAPNAHRSAVLGGGATYNVLGISPSDAAYVDSTGLLIGDIARIYGIPASRLDTHFRQPVNTGDDEIYWATVQTYMTLIEEGLRHDPDLFPTASGIRPKFHFDALLRISPTARFGIYNQARQAGILTSNECRALEGREPLEGGDTLVAIPAGAGPQGAILPDGSFQGPPDGPANATEEA